MRLRSIIEVRGNPLGETPYTAIVLGALLVANVVQAAKIFDLFWSNASRTAYAIQGLVAFAYIVVAFHRRHFEIVGAALCLLGFLLFAHLVFVMNTHTHANFNAILTYMPLLSFVAFYESAMPIRQLLRVQLVICTLYVLFYILTYSTILHSGAGGGVILNNHNGEGGRVYLAGAYASFLALFAVRAKRQRLRVRVALLGMAALAILMSGTRAFFAVLVLVLMFSALSLMNKQVRLLFLVLTGAIMLVILGGLVSASWNPFLYMSWDDSANYRASEYLFAIRAIKAHWLLGVGTPTDFKTLQAYLETPKYEPLYASDLGVIAPFFEFGVIGLAAFVATTYFCLKTAMISAEFEMQALQLNCITCAIYGAASPLMLFEPSSMFVMLLVAAYLRARRPAPVPDTHLPRPRSLTVRRRTMVTVRWSGR